MGDVVKRGNISRDQAAALIERARRLLEDAGDGTAAIHLQDAIDALEGKPCRQAERDTIVQFELRHRFRNIVAVTQSLVSQTLRPGAPIEDARERLTERLAAMGAAVDLLLGAEWESSPLDAIVRASLAHYADHRERIHCKGPEVMIGSNAVISLTLALHELETNAIKYGALSVPDGRVDLAWSLVGSGDEPKLWLQWCEHGGPPVSPPTRQGFGTRLISSAIGRFLSAEVQLDYTPGGVTWIMIAPLSAFSS
nr:sensor histidine kinase [Sphingomonas sp. CROZ-RG-20F-R02-07]